MNILVLCLYAFIATIIRYLLTSIDYNKYFKREVEYNIGLFICNITGAIGVLYFMNISSELSIGFFGALTSISSLVTQKVEYIAFSVIIVSLLSLVL